MTEKDYPRSPRLLCRSATVLSSGALPKSVDVPCEHVGACIMVHGVNDVGVGFQAVEAGLCEGLTERMKWFPDKPNHASPYTPGRYRMPTAADARRLEDDPDAVFYKRQLGADTHSPVIPVLLGLSGHPR